MSEPGLGISPANHLQPYLTCFDFVPSSDQAINEERTFTVPKYGVQPKP